MSASSTHQPASPSGKAIVRESLSGPCAGDYLTATSSREKPRRQTTGMRLSATLGLSDRGPSPHVCAYGSLNESRTASQAAQPAQTARRSHPGASYVALRHEPTVRRGGRPSPIIRQARKCRCRREIVRESLSGSCAGDYLTATTVKEKPRRQTTGSRLRATIGRSERGPCPPVCAHGPLNEFRALTPSLFEGASHFTRREPVQKPVSLTCHNGAPCPAGVSKSIRPAIGTNRRRTTFQ